MGVRELIEKKKGSAPAPASAPTASPKAPTGGAVARLIAERQARPTTPKPAPVAPRTTPYSFGASDPILGIQPEFDAIKIDQRSQSEKTGESAFKWLWKQPVGLFNKLTDKISETKYFQDVARGLNARDEAIARGDGSYDPKTSDFFGEALLDTLSSMGSAVGQGTADALNLGGSVINFSTRAVYGEDNAIGNFVKGFAGDMSKTLTSDRMKAVQNQEFGKDKLMNPDFWLLQGTAMLPTTIGFLKLGQGSYKVAGSVGTKIFGTSKFGQIASGALATTGSAMTMRGFESASIAEDTYQQALDKGMSKEEAHKAASKVFWDTAKLAGIDAVQAAMAFSPLGKMLGRSGVMGRIASESAGLVAAGSTEAFEEIYQYGAQEKALGNEFSWTDPEALEAGVLGFAMGATFQGAGRVASVDQEKAKEEYFTDVLRHLPAYMQTQLDTTATTAEKEAYLESLSETNPDVVTDAVKALETEHESRVKATTDIVSSVGSLPSGASVKEKLDTGMSSEEVILQLANEGVSTQEAEALVNGVVSGEVDTTPAPTFGDRTGLDLQKDFESMNQNFEQGQAEVTARIEELKAEIEATTDAKQKATLQQEVEDLIAESEISRTNFDNELVESSNATRSSIERLVAKEYPDLTPEQLQSVVDGVSDQLTSEGGLRRAGGVPVRQLVSQNVERVAPKAPEPTTKKPKTSKKLVDKKDTAENKDKKEPENQEELGDKKGLSKMTDKELNDERIRLVNKSLKEKLTQEETTRLGLVVANIRSRQISGQSTQKDKVKEVVAKKGKASIKEIAEETNILVPNVRRILGVGAKDGEFERVDSGVYTIKHNGQDVAVIIPGDAVATLPRLAKEGFKADMVFLDIPYDTPAVKGGNRGVKFDLITVDQFNKVLTAVKKILRNPNSPVIHMFSQAKSGIVKMQKYNDLFPKQGFIPVGRGEFQKTFADGSPVTSPNGKVALPEGIIVFTQSGKTDKQLDGLDFKLVRPKGYQTEKPALMLKKMIEMTTEEGDVVLDPFAGSGVTIDEAVKSGRKGVGIEVKKEQAEKIKERVEGSINKFPKILATDLEAKKADPMNYTINYEGSFIGLGYGVSKDSKPLGKVGEIIELDGKRWVIESIDRAGKLKAGNTTYQLYQVDKDGYLMRREKADDADEDGETPAEEKKSEVTKFVTKEDVADFIEENKSKTLIEQWEQILERSGNDYDVALGQYVLLLKKEKEFFHKDTDTEGMTMEGAKAWREYQVEKYGEEVARDLLIFTDHSIVRYLYQNLAIPKEVAEKYKPEAVEEVDRKRVIPKVTSTSVYTRIKTIAEAKALLEEKGMIADDGTNLDRFGQASRGVEVSAFKIKPDLLTGGHRENVLTDSYVLIADKPTVRPEIEKFYKKAGYDVAQIKTLSKDASFPDWKTIIPKDLGKPATIEGFFKFDLKNSKPINYFAVSIVQGKNRYTYNADKIAYIRSMLPNAQMLMNDTDGRLIFVEDGKVVGMAMNMNNSINPFWVDTPKKKAPRAKNEVPETTESKKGGRIAPWDREVLGFKFTVKGDRIADMTLDAYVDEHLFGVGEQRKGNKKILTSIWKSEQSKLKKSEVTTTKEEDLLEEAREYKTAEEFVKSQGVSFYHTTPAKFDKFDKKFLGENTNYDNARFGFFFADSLAQIDQFKDVLQKGFGGTFAVDPTKKTAEEIAQYRIIEKITRKDNFFNFNYNARDLTPDEARDFADFATEQMGGLYDSEGEQADLTKMSDAELVTFLKEEVFIEDLDPDSSFLPQFTEQYFGKFVEYLENKGYKGMVTDYGNGQDEYLIFDPNILPDRAQLIEIWNQANQTTIKNEDVGVKIGGAAKDRFSELAIKYTTDLSDNDIVKLPLAKLLPTIDFKALAEAGVDENAISLYVTMRAELPKKPVGRYTRSKTASWIEQVKFLRDVAGRMLLQKNTEGATGVFEKLNEVMEKAGETTLTSSIGATINLHKKFDFLENPEVQKYTVIVQTGHRQNKETAELEKVLVYKLRKNGKTVSATYDATGGSYRSWGDNIEEVYAVMEKELAQDKAGKKPLDLKDYIGVYRQGSKVMTAFKKGSRFVEFEVFASAVEAREALKDPAKLEEWVKSIEESVSFDENNFRVAGLESSRSYRDGKNISAEEFRNTFGFKGVEFGNWVNQQERQDRLNLAYDAFKELANTLGVPDKSISLNGELGFAFGSRGRKGAIAHYEPDFVVINLTKEGGIGSIAHEWWHAFDNYLGRRNGDTYGYVSDMLRYERPEVADAFRNLMLAVGSSDVYTRSKKADQGKSKPYFATHVEMSARMFESYVFHKMQEAGIENNALVGLRKFADVAKDLNDMYPYARSEEEVKMVTDGFDKIFKEILVEDSPSRAMYKLRHDVRSDVNLQQREFVSGFSKFESINNAKKNTQLVARSEFLTDIRGRWKLSFDVVFADVILAGVRSNHLSKELENVEAFGLYQDNTIALVKDAVEGTDRHEVVHLTMENAHRIPLMVKNGITKAKLIQAQALKMGWSFFELDKMNELQIQMVEEELARNFESYRKNHYEPKGIIRKFFVLLKKLYVPFKNFLNGYPDVIQDYYELLEFGEDVNAEMIFLENQGLVQSFINQGVLDLRKAPGEARLKKKEGDDALTEKLVVEYNQTSTRVEQLEKDTDTWKEELGEKLEAKGMLATVVKGVSDEVKRVARFTHRKPPRTLTPAGELAIKETDVTTKELYEYLERRTELNETKKRLRTLRKDIASARKAGKKDNKALRDLQRRLNMRKKFLARKEYYVTMGEKRGYRDGSVAGRKQIREQNRAKRERDDKIQTLKTVFRRVKKATKTGAYLPVDYQERLLALYESIDLVSMSAATQKKLLETAEFFLKQGGEIPENVAEKLTRLSKTPVGKMDDATLDALVTEVVRIYENGVLKKKLMKSRDEKVLAENVAKLVASTHQFNTEVPGKDANSFINRMRRGMSKASSKIYDPARFASYVDGATDYQGEHYKQIVEPVRQAINEAELETNLIIKEALEDLKTVTESFTDDEMVRITYYSALEQEAETQAEALVDYYSTNVKDPAKRVDFTAPLTESERTALDIMRSVFKRIRPDIAATYEAINNRPFPDIENYFPLSYDTNVESFTIEENVFDFDVKKTAQGFTMERQNQPNRVLDTNIFRTFVSQVKKQVYYSKVQPELESIKALLNSKEYKAKADKVALDYWSQYITDVATNGRGQRGWVQQIMDWARGNVTVAILGYKISTVLVQVSGAFDGMMNVRKELGWGAAAKVFPELVTLALNKAKLDSIVESSKELQNRQGGQIDIAEMQNMYRGTFSPNAYIRWWQGFRENAFIGIRIADIRVAGAVFNTMKQGYLKQGLTEAEAVARAEQIMILSQSSHNVANRPQILNSSSSKFFFPFSSFIFNAFNNARYDAVTMEIKKHGTMKGILKGSENLSFVGMAVTYEIVMYMLLSSLFGYDDDEQPLWKRYFASIVGRVPGGGYLIAFDGSFEGLRVNNPAVEAVDKIADNVGNLFKDGASNKEVYNVLKNALTVMGFPGTQQLNQILTAPDIAGMGSIGRNLDIAYDDRTNVEKRVEYLQPIIEKGGEITAEQINEMAIEVYGKDYVDGDAQYKANKKAEIIKEVSIRQKYGYEDPIVNATLEGEDNNAVKSVVARLDNPEQELGKYNDSLSMFGIATPLFSDQLRTELRRIARATPEEREMIALLAEAEDDAQRNAVIQGNKEFARRAFSEWKVIPKAYYEGI